MLSITRKLALFESFLALLLIPLMSGCAPDQPSLPLAHPNGQALWTIIHQQCVPNERLHGQPAPCALVSLDGGEEKGFVVLKDRRGVAQQLIMPTAKITGIEDPTLMKGGGVNYFAKAWDEHRLLEDRLGRSLRRDQISIAVNSVHGRSQDQLHLHLDCIAAPVAAALANEDGPRDARWSTIQLKDHPYKIRWIAGDAITVDPFRVLAAEMPGAQRNMGAWTLAVVGATAPDGTKGFYLLAERENPSINLVASSEELQDHDCKNSGASQQP